MFTDILSHDLRNPAGVIRGYSQLLLEQDIDEKINNM